MRTIFVTGALCLSAACTKGPSYVAPPATEYSVAKAELTLASTDTVQVATVSPEFIRVIGIRAVLGRLFIQDDFRATETPTAVLTYASWMHDFGGHPDIIGRTVRLNGTDVIAVDVTPRDVEFPKGVSIWVPRR